MISVRVPPAFTESAAVHSFAVSGLAPGLLPSSEACRSSHCTGALVQAAWIPDVSSTSRPRTLLSGGPSVVDGSGRPRAQQGAAPACFSVNARQAWENEMGKLCWEGSLGQEAGGGDTEIPSILPQMGRAKFTFTSR